MFRSSSEPMSEKSAFGDEECTATVCGEERRPISCSKQNPYSFDDDDFNEPYAKPSKMRKLNPLQDKTLLTSFQDHNQRNAQTSGTSTGRGDAWLDFKTPGLHLRQFVAENVSSHTGKTGLKELSDSCEDGVAADTTAARKDHSSKSVCSEDKEKVTVRSEAGGSGDKMETVSDIASNAQPISSLNRRVVYVHNQEMMNLCNQLPRIPDRAVRVHSLIEVVGLLKYIRMVSPEPIDHEQLLQFHSADYLEFLQKMNHQEDEEKVSEEEAEQYGLTYDCPVQVGVFDCATLVAGATVTAAQALCDGTCDVAINWCGGWHHAQRSGASGFCYINDIALGILKLREKFSRVLYIDLDLHHGDGVENAFCTTPHVLTLSLHKYAPGFFPGSGSISDVGYGKGKFCTVNVPLHDGICDPEYFSVFKRVMTSVCERYKPEAVVCQCGADGLAGDPMSSFNLSLLAYIHCVRFILDHHLPTLLLGGGGYHHTNTARCWAALTAVCVGRRLPQDVPDHEFFTEYGPDYEMSVPAGHRKNHNSHDYLISLCRRISENLKKLP